MYFRWGSWEDLTSEGAASRGFCGEVSLVAMLAESDPRSRTLRRTWACFGCSNSSAGSVWLGQRKPGRRCRASGASVRTLRFLPALCRVLKAQGRKQGNPREAGKPAGHC